MIDNTNTILLAESGDLEVYEGKEPKMPKAYPKKDRLSVHANYIICTNHWLSTKKIVKMAEEELYKMIDYLNIWNKNVSYPIDVSDIVTLKPTHKTPTDHFLGHLGEMELQCYFTPQPVDKEEETQEEPQHILWVEVLKMIENNKAAHLMKYFIIKRR